MSRSFLLFLLFCFVFLPVHDFELRVRRKMGKFDSAVIDVFSENINCPDERLSSK